MEQDNVELLEQILYHIDDFIDNNVDIYSKPKYRDILYYEVLKIFQELYQQIDKEEIEKYIEYSIEYYFENINIQRSYLWSVKPHNNNNFDFIAEKILFLQNKPQPDQKSPEWYNFRHNIISASSCYKALSDSQCKQNELICKKCEPIKFFKNFNITTPFHHGHKYEPLSVQLYEYLNKTKIGEFGCILHTKYSFLGASPDGINIDKNSPLFGRMLEIKNIVNRKITGIPLEAYWCQMQLQMECCDLEECDFLETRFKEYTSEEEFEKDGTFKLTKEKNFKGIIVQFYDSKQGALYEYMPFQCTKTKYMQWFEKLMEEKKNITWIRNIYWFLDEYSCVLVPRNKQWFEFVLPKFKACWDIIIKERKTGFEHRKPKKREKKKEKCILKVETEKFSTKGIEQIYSGSISF